MEKKEYDILITKLNTILHGYDSMAVSEKAVDEMALKYGTDKNEYMEAINNYNNTTRFIRVITFGLNNTLEYMVNYINAINKDSNATNLHLILMHYNSYNKEDFSFNRRMINKLHLLFTLKDTFTLEDYEFAYEHRNKNKLEFMYLYGKKELTI